MTRFQLVVRPDGRALLTTTEKLSEQMVAHLREHLRGWEAGEYPIVVIPECSVVQVAEIEIDLESAETVVVS
ncbi:MAG: hypothetical protein V4515_12275 [Chloroflexota bacterium]